MLLLLGAALVGALSATFVCRWRFARSVAELHKRLEQSEQARQTERDRGQQMRSQIAQLSKLVTGLQQRQRRTVGEQRRAELDQIVPDQGPAGALPPLPANGFADTLPM